jgi:hypothetical protein
MNSKLKITRPRLYFAHEFKDGRIMTVTCDRSEKLPQLICKPEFCGAEEQAIIAEYCIWGGHIFDTLLKILDKDEIYEIQQWGGGI